MIQGENKPEVHDKRNGTHHPLDSSTML